MKLDSAQIIVQNKLDNLLKDILKNHSKNRFHDINKISNQISKQFKKIFKLNFKLNLNWPLKNWALKNWPLKFQKKFQKNFTKRDQISEQRKEDFNNQNHKFLNIRDNIEHKNSSTNIIDSATASRNFFEENQQKKHSQQILTKSINPKNNFRSGFRLINYNDKLKLNNSHRLSLVGHSGFYIYGGVGRGKTMLMQNFYKKIHDISKKYFHFNDFMTQIHQILHEIRQDQKKYRDELHEALLRIIMIAPKKPVKVICFDEFQVIDVADAMLLSRIFEYFFHHKIILVITSNTHPLELYANGLQRDLFLKFVNDILLKNIEVLNLDSKTDYRILNRTKIVKRYFVSNPKNRKIFKEIIEQVVKDIPRKTAKIKVWGREIKVKKSFDKIAIFNFDELFLENYSAADYRAICKRYHTIFLKKIPQLCTDNINEIRRFTLFIDEAYEQKNTIIFLAKNNLKKLDEIVKFAPYFSRTISRINEIISDNYQTN